MLKTKQLQYAYAEQKNIVFPDIDCKSGEKWLILGQSGKGKTTLLHLLGALLSPKEGEIWVDNQHLNSLSQAEKDKFRGQHIGIVFQQSHFIRALTVEENLILAMQLAGNQVDKKKIHHLLERLNLSHKINALPERLSQGEQQRAAIARALVNSPAIILADEPTAALDDLNCEEVIGLLEKQSAEAGATLIIVTHDNRLKERFPNQIQL